MKERYEKLKELLDSLLIKLPFPMGIACDMTMSITMQENESWRLSAITTTKGYIVISANGGIINCNSVEEVENSFLMYFKNHYPIQKMVERLYCIY